MAILLFLLPILPLVARPTLDTLAAHLFVPDVDRRLLVSAAAIALSIVAIRSRRPVAIDPLAAGFVAWLAASALWAIEPLRALDRATEIGSALALGALIFAALASDLSRERALRALLFGCATAGVLGILQSLGAGPAFLGPRPAATFGNTNAAAEVQALAVALGAGLLARRASLPVAIAAAIVFVHLVLTRGRGGLVAAVVASGVAAILARWAPREKRSRAAGPRPRRIALVAAGATAILLLLATGGFATLGERLASLADPEFPSHRVRIRIFEGALRLAADHKALGVGAGHFRAEFPPYRAHEEWRLSGPETEVESAHDDYLEILAETGPLGLLLFVLLLASRAIALFRRARAGDAVPDPFLLLPVLAAFAVAALFRSPLSNPTALAFAGLSLGATRVADNATGKSGLRAAAAVVAAATILLGGAFSIAYEIAAHHLAAASRSSRDGAAGRAADLGRRGSAFLPWDDRAANVRAHWERVAGRRSEAIATFHDVLRANPNHVPARLGLAAELAASGDDAAAIAVLEDARRIAPWEPRVLLALALRTEPRDPAAARDLALLSGLLDPVAKQPWAALVAILDGAAGEALPARRRESIRQCARGALTLALGDPSRADLHFRAALLADLDSPEPHFFLAIRSAERGDLTAAATSLRAARSGLPAVVDPLQEPLLRAAARALGGAAAE